MMLDGTIDKFVFPERSPGWSSGLLAPWKGFLRLLTSRIAVSGKVPGKVPDSVPKDSGKEWFLLISK